MSDEDIDMKSSKLHSGTVRTYCIDGLVVSVDMCWKGDDPEADGDRFYDIYDSEGNCLNLGDPWHDDGEGPPSQEDVEWLVSSNQRTGRPS